MSDYTYVLLGGTGFIGQELALMLASLQSGVLCIGRQGQVVLPGVDVILQDLESPAWNLPAAENIFILVGQNHAQFDKEQELRLLSNIVEKINALPSASRVFYFSTVLLYGDSEKRMREEDLPQPKDRYSQFKYEAEGFIRQHIDAKHQLTILRLANVYGSPKNKGFISVLMKAHQEHRELKINGGGKQERDYIYIDDVTGAIVRIVQASTSLPCEIINIATGTSQTLLYVKECFEEIVQQKILAFVDEEVSQSEVFSSRLDNSKLVEIYGYERFISLQDGLQRTWKKYQEQDK